MEIKILQEVYTHMKQHHELDYISIDVASDKFNWDLFFDKFYENLVYEICEQYTFKLVKDHTFANGIRHLEYKFADDYIGILDAVPCNEDMYKLSKSILYHDHKKVNSDPLKVLQHIFVNNADKYILKFQFRDDQGDMYITNKKNNKAFAILKTAIKSLKDALFRIGMQNIVALEFHVSKSEYKRLDLYKKLLERENFHFKNSYEDKLADSTYITYYIW